MITTALSSTQLINSTRSTINLQGVSPSKSSKRFDWLKNNVNCMRILPFSRTDLHLHQLSKIHIIKAESILRFQNTSTRTKYSRMSHWKRLKSKKRSESRNSTTTRVRFSNAVISWTRNSKTLGNHRLCSSKNTRNGRLNSSTDRIIFSGTHRNQNHHRNMDQQHNLHKHNSN